MLASPLRVFDVLAGHLLWVGVRLLTVTTIYLAMMAAFGAVESPLAPVALPAAILTGLAFAAPIMGFAATQTNDTGFSSLYRFLIVPLFLFSGTFFPVTQLPRALQVAAEVTPLYHGVALCRGLVIGHGLTAGAAAVHVAYLVVLVVLGCFWARRSYERRLVV
jgi:lipooligosaccharide transport system permease protein